MILLSDILRGADLQKVIGSTEIPVSFMTADSRQVSEGSLFVAVKGNNFDGHHYIPNAIRAGARAVVYQNDIDCDNDVNVTYIKVPDSSFVLGILASNYYGNPSHKIKVVGVTGTNGKTTTATLLYRMFRKDGYMCGLISTVVNRIGDESLEAKYTTPDAIELNKLFARMVSAGCTHCFMEVSSHAIHQHRVTGVKFEGGIFTNISLDHLDYHKTFANYLKVKKSFFDTLDANTFAITNVDDKNGLIMLQNTTARKFTYGLKKIADYKGHIIEDLKSGLMMQIDGREVWSKLVGEFNAYNLLAIYACARQLGMEKETALTILSGLDAVEGRFDYVLGRDKITGIVDYAHTPDALENVLKTINNLRKPEEKLIVVIGCGGNRDSSKRPLMASITASMSDSVVITTDNPRFESPDAIIADMVRGLESQDEKKVLIIPNRREAIKVAASLARSGDFILVAGKGHEKYQEIKGIKYPFDDKETLIEFLGQTL